MATAAKHTDDLLRCNICMEVFKNPSSLPCQHTFCRECLSDYIKSRPDVIRKRSVPCPSCRQKAAVPNPSRPMKEWAGQFKASFLIVSMMDSLSQQETKHCSVCNKTPSSTLYWCSECQALFCDQCLVMHNKMPNSMNHEVTAHQEGQQVQKPLICKEHDEKIKLFCRDCRKCLCTVCCSIKHRRCEVVVTLKEMLPVVNKDVTDYLENLRQSLDQKRMECNDFKRKIGLVNARKSNVKAEIKDSFEKFHTFLHERENELTSTVDDKLLKPIGHLESEQKVAQQNMNLLIKNVQRIKNALELGDEVQLFQIYQSLDIEPSVSPVSQGTWPSQIFRQPSIAAQAYGTPNSYQAHGYGTPNSYQVHGYGTPNSYQVHGYGTPNSYQVHGYGTPHSYQVHGYGTPHSYQVHGYGTPNSYQVHGYGTPNSYQVHGYGTPNSYQVHGYGTPNSYQVHGYGTPNSYQVHDYETPDYYRAPTRMGIPLQVHGAQEVDNKGVPEISFVYDFNSLENELRRMAIRVNDETNISQAFQ